MPDPIPRNKSARGWQLRGPAIRRVWSSPPFRRPRVNVGRHRAPPQPSSMKSSTGVVVGVLLLVVVVLVVWIVVLRFHPSGTFASSMAVPPAAVTH